MGKRGPQPKNLKEKLMAKLLVDSKGCWIYQGTRHTFGYGVLPLGHRGTISAHRAAWQVFCGPIPKGLNVLHHCDVPPCFNPEHLWLGTQKDNLQDALKKGRCRNKVWYGEDHVSHKVTKAQVEEMRKLYQSDLLISHRQLAKQYKISATEVGRILRKDVWRF